MGREQGLDLLKQEICDVKSEEQRFTCKGEKVTPVKNSGLCVTASGNCFSVFVIPLMFLQLAPSTLTGVFVNLKTHTPKSLSSYFTFSDHSFIHRICMFDQVAMLVPICRVVSSL